MAEVVGAEKVFNYISKYRFRKIKLSKGSDVVYTDSVTANGQEAILLDRFQNWVSDFIEPDNFREYKLELFGTNKEEAEVKQLTPVIKISVQFNQKEYAPARTIAGVGTSGVDFKEYTALAVENAKLNAQLSRLEEKLNDLVVDADEEEAPEPTISERIGSVLLDRADDIISVLLMKLGGALTPVTPQQPISGVDPEYVSKEAIDHITEVESWENDILDTAEEFRAINPDILEDLKRLLNLAKTNKPFFDMLIKQLRNM